MLANDTEAQRLVFALQQQGWRVRPSLEQTATGRLATVRLNPPLEREELLVDLLFASSGLEPETVAAARGLDVGRVRTPVAAVGHLIAMKVLSESPKRLQDRIDLAKLLAVALARSSPGPKRPFGSSSAEASRERRAYPCDAALSGRLLP